MNSTSRIHLCVVFIFSCAVAIWLRFVSIPYASVLWDESTAIRWAYTTLISLQTGDSVTLLTSLKEQFYYSPLHSWLILLLTFPFDFTISAVRTTGLIWFIGTSILTFCYIQKKDPKRLIAAYIAIGFLLTSPLFLYHSSVQLKEIIGAFWTLAVVNLYRIQLTNKLNRLQYSLLAISLCMLTMIKYQYLFVFCTGLLTFVIVDTISSKNRKKIFVSHITMSIRLALPIFILLLLWLSFPSPRFIEFLKILQNATPYTHGQPVLDYLLFHLRGILYFYSASPFIGILFCISVIASVCSRTSRDVKLLASLAFTNIGLSTSHYTNIQERYIMTTFPFLCILAGIGLETLLSTIYKKLPKEGRQPLGISIGGSILLFLLITIRPFPTIIYATASVSLKGLAFNQLDYSDQWFTYTWKTWPKMHPKAAHENPSDVAQYIIDTVNMQSPLWLFGRTGEMSPDYFAYMFEYAKKHSPPKPIEYKGYFMTLEVFETSRFWHKDFDMWNSFIQKSIATEIPSFTANLTKISEKTFPELGVRVNIYARTDLGYE